MKTPKEMVVEMFSNMKEEDIVKQLKSFGLDDDNIKSILSATKPKDSNK